MPSNDPTTRGLLIGLALTVTCVAAILVVTSRAVTIQVALSQVDEIGGQLFEVYCATCHGTGGHGDGPMADRLRRMPPDLTQFAARNGGVFPSERVYRIIDGRDVPSHGDGEMPVWGDVFRSVPGRPGAEAARARIAAIVRHLEAMQERTAGLKQTPPVAARTREW